MSECIHCGQKIYYDKSGYPWQWRHHASNYIECFDGKNTVAESGEQSVEELRKALQAYVMAQSRMLERWSELEPESEARGELWRALHKCEIAARAALAASPSPASTEERLRKALPACKGKNCGCTDGRSHSKECVAEYEDAIKEKIR